MPDRKVTSELPRLEGVTNFRELGGLPTRDGRRVRARRLFRSSHWGRATASDVEVLASLGVGLVIDFRSDLDREHEGHDRLPEGSEHLALATEDPAGQTDTRSLILQGGLEAVRANFADGRAERYMRESAARLATDRMEVFGSFLARLARPDVPPALFHCSAGKDRAGWAASVLLLALDVEEEHVIEHYLLSNVHYEASTHHAILPQLDPEIREMLQPLIDVRDEYVRASIDAACQRFGDLDGYFSAGLGLSDEQRDQLRANWLEPD